MKSFIFHKIITIGPLKRLPFLVSSIIAFGWMPLVLVAFAFFTTDQDPPLDLLVSFVLAMFWLPVGVAVIVHGHQRKFPEFAKNIQSLLPDEDVDEFISKFQAIMTNYGWKFGLFYMCTGPIIVYVFLDIGTDLFGVTSFFDPIILGIVLIVMLDAIVVGYAFGALIAILRAIQEVASQEVKLNPLAPDRFGGLGPVGDIAITATLYGTSGIMIVPLIVASTATLGRLRGIIVGGGMIGIYSGALIVTFFLPILIINRLAAHEKQRMLEEAGEEYQKLSDQALQAAESDFASGMRSIVLRNRFLDVEEMRVYPFNISQVIKLAISALLPIAIFVIQSLLSEHFFN